MLSEFKERTAIYGIVENSNFVKTVAKDKLANFYKQNPGLVPPSDTSRKLAIMDMASKDVIKEVSEAEEDQSNFFLEKKVQPLPTPSKRAGKMPTLDLQGIRKMKE